MTDDTHTPTPSKLATLVPADAFTIGTYSVDNKEFFYSALYLQIDLILVCTHINLFLIFGFHIVVHHPFSFLAMNLYYYSRTVLVPWSRLPPSGTFVFFYFLLFM
jgi:hypothetical protein